MMPFWTCPIHSRFDLMVEDFERLFDNRIAKRYSMTCAMIERLGADYCEEELVIRWLRK